MYTSPVTTWFPLGLPNAMGGYDETPEIMSERLKVLVMLALCWLLYLLVFP